MSLGAPGALQNAAVVADVKEKEEEEQQDEQHQQEEGMFLPEPAEHNEEVEGIFLRKPGVSTSDAGCVHAMPVCNVCALFHVCLLRAVGRGQP